MEKSRANPMILLTLRKGRLDTCVWYFNCCTFLLPPISPFRRMIANILHEIQQYQNFPYRLRAEPSIQDFLQSHDPKGDMGDNQYEDYLYDQSVEIEPRDQPYKKAVSCLIDLLKTLIYKTCFNFSYIQIHTPVLNSPDHIKEN